MVKRRQSNKKKAVKFFKGGDNIVNAPPGVLSNNSVLPSSAFLSTGTGGDTAKFETAVSKAPSMTGGRRSKKSKKNTKRKTKKWFGLF